MRQLSWGLYLAAACFLTAALLGHADAWSPAALLGLAATVTRMQGNNKADEK